MTYIQITSSSSQLSAYLQRVKRQLPEVLDDAVRISAVEAQSMFASTTGTWMHQPTFVLQHEGTGRWGIKTDDQIYKWVDLGTKAHVITARNAPYLVFRWPSKPKTQPNVLASYMGARGDQWARKKSVHHPGTKPRNFSRNIQKQAQGPTVARLRAALKQATYGSGAGL